MVSQNLAVYLRVIFVTDFVFAGVVHPRLASIIVVITLYEESYIDLEEIPWKADRPRRVTTS